MAVIGDRLLVLRCVHSESVEKQIPSIPLLVSSFLMDYNQQQDSKDTENENGKCSEYGCPNINKLFATFRKVWSTFGTHCPVRGLLAQTMVHFAHFQVLPTFKFRAGGQLITLSLCKSMLSNFCIPPSFTLASLPPQDSNPLFYCSAPVLHST